MTMYQCPLWKGCTAHTDPSSHVCDHVGPHEWSCADGDECGWLEGECTEVCKPLASGESICNECYLCNHDLKDHATDASEGEQRCEAEGCDCGGFMELASGESR